MLVKSAPKGMVVDFQSFGTFSQPVSIEVADVEVRTFKYVQRTWTLYTGKGRAISVSWRGRGPLGCGGCQCYLGETTLRRETLCHWSDWSAEQDSTGAPWLVLAGLSGDGGREKDQDQTVQ